MQEKMTHFDPHTGNHIEYFKLTVRQLLDSFGDNFLVMRSDNPRFHGSIQVHAPIVGKTVEGPIRIGVGSEVNLLGKVVASFALQSRADF